MRIADIFALLQERGYTHAYDFSSPTSTIRNYARLGTNEIVGFHPVEELTTAEKNIIVGDDVALLPDMHVYQESVVLLTYSSADSLVSAGLRGFLRRSKACIESIQTTDYTGHPLAILAFIDDGISDKYIAKSNDLALQEHWNTDLVQQARNSRRIRQQALQQLKGTASALEAAKSENAALEAKAKSLAEELESERREVRKFQALYKNYAEKHSRLSDTFAVEASSAFEDALSSPGRKTLELPSNIAKSALRRLALRVRKTKTPQVGMSDSPTSVSPPKGEIRKPIKFFACEALDEFKAQGRGGPTILVYADVSINVVDGSSIWLTSVCNLAARCANTIVLSREDAKNDLITSNFADSANQVLLLQPSDLGREDRLSVADVSDIISILDAQLEGLEFIVVRGLEIASELSKTNDFYARLVPYITNFYKHTIEGPVLRAGSPATIDRIAQNSRTWLWQTPAMESFLSQALDMKMGEGLPFPPVLPDMSVFGTNASPRMRSSDSPVVIGYAGKIQPDWGVIELLREVKRLNQGDANIVVRIVTSKISPRSDMVSGVGFVEEVNSLLDEDFVDLHSNVNRQRSIELLQEVDFVWCFRPEYFERCTLELSTKLLEALAIKKPAICFPASINVDLLGKNYPYFISSADTLGTLIENNPRPEIDATLGERIAKEYGFEGRIDSLKGLLTPLQKRVVVFAGHDFKFVDHYYSHLKSNGYQCVKDYWEWGETETEARSQELYEKADIIFCEWGLANAVWYSQHNQEKKPLYIRVHLQEINPKARRFGPQIDIENVTRVIFVSERVRDVAIEKWNWPIEKTVVIPNYVLVDSYTPAPAKERSINLGLVGITPQRKRFDRAIDLLEKLVPEFPEAKLFVKGHRPEDYWWMHAPGRAKELDYYYEQYQRIENSELLRDAVVFDGFGNDMRRWYKKIDFILSPSDFESFHYALADGVSSGCLPVVWNWEEAEKIYSPSWPISTIEEAANRIRESLLLAENEFASLVEENRSLIVDRYGYKSVFERLSAAIELSEASEKLGLFHPEAELSAEV